MVTLGKVIWEVLVRRYDIVVGDCPPTGQVTGLLRAPRTVAELVPDGWVLTNLAIDDPTKDSSRSGNGALVNLAAGETCVQDTGNPGASGQGCAAAGPIAERFDATHALSGSFNLYLRAPGAGNDGSVDVSADLSAIPWLRHDWTGGGPADPTGRATFGLYRGNDRQIYIRELY